MRLEIWCIAKDKWRMHIDLLVVPRTDRHETLGGSSTMRGSSSDEPFSGYFQ